MNPKGKLNSSDSEQNILTVTIDIRPLKIWVSKNLPKDSPLRDVLLSERDALEIHEFLAKVETWLNLQSSIFTRDKK